MFAFFAAAPPSPASVRLIAANGGMSSMPVPQYVYNTPSPAMLPPPLPPGKSTVLRSLAAVSLLGVSGLLVPAAAVDMSWLDTIMLRNFSGDSPAEGRSAFGAEMFEMR
jgi:hypothetical protein